MQLNCRAGTALAAKRGETVCMAVYMHALPVQTQMAYTSTGIACSTQLASTVHIHASMERPIGSICQVGGQDLEDDACT